MANFPPEIMTDIICRLPVKDLLRCRCVSKSWRSMIENPDFIRMHLKHSTETDTNSSLIFANCNKQLFGVELDVLDSAVKLDGPKDHGNIVGSCSGLIALAKGRTSAVEPNH